MANATFRYEDGTISRSSDQPRNDRAVEGRNEQPGSAGLIYLSDMQEDETDVVVKIKSERHGILNPQIVRWIAFVVITVSLVACTVLCILAIWKFTESDAVWRAIATFIVVSIATAIFALVNEKLG